MTIILRSEAGYIDSGSWSFDDDSPITLGRNPNNHVVLPDLATNRRHARIVIVRGAYYLEDFRSINGTFVNETLIAVPTRLQSGDRIRLGRVVLTVEIVGEAQNHVADFA